MSETLEPTDKISMDWASVSLGVFPSKVSASNGRAPYAGDTAMTAKETTDRLVEMRIEEAVR